LRRQTQTRFLGTDMIIQRSAASPMRILPRGIRRQRRGFTLIEILMVVAALSIIAGVVVPQVSSVMDEARHAALLKDLREFTFAIERYRSDHNGLTPDLIQNETLAQLLGTTDADGNIGTGPQYPYGPYLITVPRNALNGVSRVFRIHSAPPADLSRRVGWVYHPASGQIWAGLYPDPVDLSLVQTDGSTGGN
jgi:prepilin-type N-terminal cleavage/methylation domain-containing protein